MSVALVLGLLHAGVSSAQVYECNGKWTNVPCDGKAPAFKAEKRDSHVLTPSQAAERGRKQTLLHDLTMKSIAAKRDLEIRLDIASADKICNDPLSALAECEKIVQDLDSRLSQMMTDARLVRAQENAAKEQARLRELQIESNRIQQERNEIEARKRNRNLVIIQNNQNIGNDAIRNNRLPGTRPPVIYRERETVVTSPNGTVIRDRETVPLPLQTPWGGVQIPTGRQGVSVGIQIDQ